MPNLLRASSEELSQAENTTGPDSYPTGGFSVRTDLGRVDNAMVEVDNGDYTARADPDNYDGTHFTVTVYSHSSSGEIDSGTDLSGDDFVYNAARL